MGIRDKRESTRLAGPLYVQVAAIFRSRILAGEWSGSQSLPSERSLADEIGVSLGTARKALDLLAHERLIIRRQGLGTFIADADDIEVLDRFTHLYRGADRLSISASQVDWEVGPATSDEAQSLGLEAEASVIRLQRFLNVPDYFKAIETIVVAAERFPGLAPSDDLSAPLLFSLYRKKYRVVIVSAEERISAINAGEDIGRILNISPDTAILRIGRIAREMNGHPVEWSLSHLDIGECEYVVNV